MGVGCNSKRREGFNLGDGKFSRITKMGNWKFRGFEICRNAPGILKEGKVLI